MDIDLSYTHEVKLKIKEHTLSRIRTSLEKNGTCLSSSNYESDSGERLLRFTMLADLEGAPAKLDIEFRIDANRIHEAAFYLFETPKDVNRYTLKFYAIKIFQDILSSDHNEELRRYTVRTYSRYYSCYPIIDSLVVNFDPRFLLKPQQWNVREEPLSEQILMLDVEVHAVNIEQARNVAYNHCADVNAYLSVLLDCGFEMVNSEFRIFNIKDKFGIVRSNRFRTGVVDEELGLLVKDNHYGLKDLYDKEQVDSYRGGKVSYSFAGLREDGGFDNYSTSIFDNFSNDEFLDKKFTDHKIIAPQGLKERSAPPQISDELYYLNSPLRLPSDTRKFFKAIASIDVKKRNAILACSRLYNLALTVGRTQPTLSQSYKVCAVEALGLCEGKGFSDFMVSYSKPGFDKDLTDYFYSVRSKHFHAGQFLFDEYNIEFQREIAFSFYAKNADFVNFSRYIRIAIISWIRINLLKTV